MFKISSVAGKLILFATILASGMAFLDGTVVNIAIPTIQAKLHTDITGIQWLINGYTLMLASLILISGSLGDRFGRKRIFLSGIMLFTLASLASGLSLTITELILFRVIQGIGAAMMIPGSLSIINTSFHADHRGRAIGYWSGFAGGIAALGPFLGGWLVQTLGWQSIFFINVPLGILAFFITLRFVPKDKVNAAAKLDWLGTIYLFIGLSGIAYALITGQTAGWTHLSVLASLFIGIITLIGFYFAERTAQSPLIPLQIFRSPIVLGANIVTLFLYAALNGVIFFLVLNLQQIQHYPPLYAGLSMLPSILIITFFSGTGGTLADKIGPRVPMIIGPFIVGCAMLLLAFSGLHQNYFLSYFPALILFGGGMSLVIAPLTKSALAVEEKFSGAASGVNNDISRIAALLAVALFGAIILGIFSSKLANNLIRSNLDTTAQQQILQQQDNLGGIVVPETFTPEQKTIAHGAIDTAFLFGFRWIMGINAFLAFLSSTIAVLLIHNPKNKNNKSTD